MSSHRAARARRETIGGSIRPTSSTDVLAIPEQLRDALWKVESAGLRAVGPPGGLVVAGMGGSAIGGRPRRARSSAITPRGRSCGARAYGLPSWTTPDTTVLCASYSGDTEETLACYEAAGVDRRAAASCVTTGGQLAELARADGVPVIAVRRRHAAARGRGLHDGRPRSRSPRCAASARGMHSEIDVAAEHLEELVDEWGPEARRGRRRPRRWRAQLHGTVPVVARRRA